MKINILNERPSVLNHFLSEIRDEVVQKDSMRFRRNIERIGEVMAYEISKTLDYAPIDVKTSLGSLTIPKLKHQPYLLAILRAALPLHHGFLNVFDQAESGFIGAYRAHTTEIDFGIDLNYIATDSLEGRDVIIVDPMLATGKSIVEVMAKLAGRGTPRSIHLAAVISARPGVDYLRAKLGDRVTLWTAAMDEHLNEHAYIVPGLGDAGDLAFGDKI